MTRSSGQAGVGYITETEDRCGCQNPWWRFLSVGLNVPSARHFLPRNLSPSPLLLVPPFPPKTFPSPTCMSALQAPREPRGSVVQKDAWRGEGMGEEKAGCEWRRWNRGGLPSPLSDHYPSHLVTRFLARGTRFVWCVFVFLYFWYLDANSKGIPWRKKRQTRDECGKKFSRARDTKDIRSSRELPFSPPPPWTQLYALLLQGS